MTLCRRFEGERIMRLIASVPEPTVRAVDAVLRATRKAEPRSRAEFVRQAIVEKLTRDLAASEQRSTDD